MLVKIKRQNSPTSESYWQSFTYNGNGHVTVSAVLDALNYTDDLFDTDGNPAPKIRWECSCMQAVCGGCAMVINGVPALACSTFIDEISVIYENLNNAKAYLDGSVTNEKKHHKQQYSVAKCLKCGLCLEVCPNYHPGGAFFGAVLANESYLIASQSENKAPHIVKEYKNHFGAGCSKALSCQTVCPAGIETLTSIMRMNRK